MKYHIEFTGIAEKGAHGIHPTMEYGGTSMEAPSTLEVIQVFLNKKANEGIRIIKIKVQEDALNS
jgi:hypothetical protein